MKQKLLQLCLISSTLIACNDAGKSITTGDNPLLNKFETKYEVPPFDLIKNEHFSPAIVKSIEMANAEINTIATNPDAATFANTIEALDNVGSTLNTVTSVFFNLLSANTNEKLQEVAKEVSPILSKYSDDLYLNDKLFARVKAVYDNREALHLNTEQTALLDKTYKAFVRSGANLNEQDKAKLRKINEELSLIGLNYGDNILGENNSYQLIIDKEADLKGLPADLVEAAAAEAKKAGKEGKWIFTLQNPSVMPFLQYAENRDLRKQIWNAYQNRGNNDDKFDNKSNVEKMVNLKKEKANLLGYETFAHYSLEETMAKTPDNVYKLLNQLWKPALEKANAETADIQAMMKADGINDNVQPYDWRYYSEKIRKQRYDLDEQELKPYFSLDQVRNGVFTVTQKLFGLTFKQVTDLPIYHKDVTSWEVNDQDGTLLGILFMDFHPRESKRGGAWMTSYREQQMQDGKRRIPIISIVCNFTPPSANAPALLTFDEALTFFHEFGHALHGLLSNVNYQSLAGTSVSRDFVELPSQIMENWGGDPEVLKMYAKHYQTGEPIPDALIAKLQNAGTFDQGFSTVEYLAASMLDLDYHTSKEAIKDVNAFEKASTTKMGLPEAIIPRYKSNYFNHIFAGGYSAGYYSYIWSGVLDTDAFDAFKSTELFNPEKAKLFRTEILEKGGTDDPAILYKNFRGQDPSIEPLLKKRGLQQAVNTSKK